jgi:hypothetical protein
MVHGAAGEKWLSSKSAHLSNTDPAPRILPTNLKFVSYATLHRIGCRLGIIIAISRLQLVNKMIIVGISS